MASWHPPEDRYAPPGAPSLFGSVPGGPDGNSLNERKKQLIQWLAGRGATQAGFRGSAVGRMGGIGGKGPLPSITYNPFLAQIAGRNENFPFLPSDVSSAAAHAAQSGPIGPGMGLVGAGGANPGIGGGASIQDQAPGVVYSPQPQGGAAPRNIIGVGMPPPPLAGPFNQNLNNSTAQVLSPFNPVPRFGSNLIRM